MLRKKGRLVSPRDVKKMTEEGKLKRALGRAQEKLGGVDNWTNIQKQYKTVIETKPHNFESLADGLIMSMVQRNLSNIMIRTSRITKIRNLMRQPHQQRRIRKPPPHAVKAEELEDLKTHLLTFETEDGFPCSHRRPRKYFVKQGLK